ncbi:uncharacterized protein LOC101858459 isoform X1 [Aplysia californica]|uniref:Uncharacterized protein LOC101858459 isoform X1 n=1 Tax=Aplysia californica TaxID=6500 RepID=A0ABM0JCQ0_APLCA|nr:uncharacterized protein LOC101858459 isoform X1 [Aplysia californica]
MSESVSEAFVPGLEAETNESGQLQIDGGNLKVLPPLKEDESFSQSQVHREEVMDYGDECFLLANTLTETECQHFIQEGETEGFEAIGFVRDSYRSSQRISFQSPQLADLLWKRIKGHLKDIVIDGDPHSIHIEGVTSLMQGTWVPKGLNDVFRLCRYFPTGHFAPHNDGYFVRSASERSLQTFMLYLNGDFSGGSTNFIDPSQVLFKGPDGKYCAEEKNVLCRIHPKSGLAIIFNHNRLHEGEKLGDGKKYILRTDIMYENTSASQMSEAQQEAMQLMQEADRLEASGKAMKAMELYRRAFKLFPELDK